MGTSSGAMFFARWLRDPLGMGSVIPSGDVLSRAMAQPAAAAYRVPILELGGGTGTVTEALLECGLDPHDLIVLERDPLLHRHLEHRFPSARVVRGDAARTYHVLAELGLSQVGVVVSGLPLLSMPLATRHCSTWTASAPSPASISAWTNGAWTWPSPVPRRA